MLISPLYSLSLVSPSFLFSRSPFPQPFFRVRICCKKNSRLFLQLYHAFAALLATYQHAPPAMNCRIHATLRENLLPLRVAAVAKFVPRVLKLRLPLTPSEFPLKSAGVFAEKIGDG